MVSSAGDGRVRDRKATERSRGTTGRMWIRTYRVDADGRPLGDAEHDEYAPVAPEPLARRTWPPCACPRHIASPST
ncbi:hypothetical protein OH807_38830 [Kitasatospora sp. NBC_01560]|uniref:hypothetical protein n=1 Tax=Kitasatospora sp. NBC_01560 TaxID=2975965 RepID=UPI00386E7EAE